MVDYHDHRLKKDILLLADVSEKFINACLKFQFSQIKLGCNVKNDWFEALDIDMYLFSEKGLRGGIYYIPKRYAKANNKYRKNYDPTKSSIYISHLNMNNLHDWAMSDYLHYGRFK